MTPRDAASVELQYRRVRIGNAYGRIQAASQLPGKWNMGKRLPDRWRCDIDMDNGKRVWAWLDEIQVIWDE